VEPVSKLGSAQVIRFVFMAATPEHTLSHNDVLGLPIESIVEGIRASFNRWVRASTPRDFIGGECGPFLFNFIDYLTLALPPGSEVSIWTRNGRHRISTSPDTAADRQLPAESTLQLDPKGPVLAVACGRPGAREVIESILSQIDETFLRYVSLALRLGLKQIRQSKATTIDRDACPIWPGVHDTHAEDVLDGILTHTRANLVEAIMPGDECYVFAIRWYACEDCLWGFGYERLQDKTVVQVPRKLVAPHEVGLSLKTGSLRLKVLDDGRVLLCVPCHLGGVPWLALCCELSNDAPGRWQAYTIYRDVIPRLNGVLRLLGQESYAKEMLRLFRMTDTDVDGDLNSVVERVNTIWEHLVCIYPLPKAFLRPTASPLQSPGALLLPLRAGMAEVVLADEPTPCVLAATRLKSESGAAYTKVNPEKIRDNFIAPILAVIQEMRGREARLLAVAAYKIGHPMKHRVGPVGSALRGLKDAAEAGTLTCDNARADAVRALASLRSVEALGHILDLLSRAISSLEKEQVFLIDGKPEWRSSSSYPIGERLHKIQAQVNTVNEPVLLTPPARHTTPSIVPWIVAPDGSVRPSNIFYDEIFTEILTNAARNGYRLPQCIEVELRWRTTTITLPQTGKKHRVFVFSNACRLARTQPRIGIGGPDWTPWDTTATAAVGGLLFLANLLEYAAIGTLFVRVVPVDEDIGRFEIALGLCGMQER